METYFSLVATVTWICQDVLGALIYLPLAIGLFQLASIFFRAFWVFWRYTSRLGVQDLYALYKRQQDGEGGTWVLITGANGAMGTGFAEEFACLGFNICMVSRDHKKLEEAKSSLIKKYPQCQVRTHVTDFN